MSSYLEPPFLRSPPTLKMCKCPSTPWEMWDDSCHIFPLCPMISPSNQMCASWLIHLLHLPLPSANSDVLHFALFFVCREDVKMHICSHTLWTIILKLVVLKSSEIIEDDFCIITKYFLSYLWKVCIKRKLNLKPSQLGTKDYLDSFQFKFWEK